MSANAPPHTPVAPWLVILPGRGAIELEVIADVNGNVVAHCPGVGHVPGKYQSCATRPFADMNAVGQLVRELWHSGVPAVVIPPEVPRHVAGAMIEAAANAAR